jgi:nicotinamidase-related amidase
MTRGLRFAWREEEKKGMSMADKPMHGVEIAEHFLPREERGLDLLEQAIPFLQWLENWYAGLKPLSLDEVVQDPTHTALFSVDLINGFAYEGNLSSPRVAGVIPQAVSLLQRAYARGVRHMILIQECHSKHAEEFQAFGPHGICGTSEADMVPEFAALPFADELKIVRKNSLHTIFGTGMERWLDEHPEVDTFIVIGDCTDLCVYNCALDLKLRANHHDLKRRVIVPENIVQTYDLSVAHAERLGALPHVGDFQHALFLYMMALNQIQVVKALA